MSAVKIKSTDSSEEAFPESVWTKNVGIFLETETADDDEDNDDSLWLARLIEDASKPLFCSRSALTASCRVAKACVKKRRSIMRIAMLLSASKSRWSNSVAVVVVVGLLLKDSKDKDKGASFIMDAV